MSVMDVIDKRAGSIGPMPAVAFKLNEVLADPDCDAGDIVEVIRFDPGITAQILRVANSAESAARHEIGSLSEAVVRLGNRRVVEIALASAVRGFFLSQEVCRPGLRDAIWKHALASALASELLARGAPQSEREMLFTAALLHDLGQLVLAEQTEGVYGVILARIHETTRPFIVIERELFGVDHTEIGERIAVDQSFPTPIRDAIRWHHDPGGLEPSDDRIELIRLSDVLCGMLGMQSGWDGLAGSIPDDLVEKYSLSQGGVQEILAQLVGELRDVERRFGLSV